MIINLLKATKNDLYSPDGAFNLMCLLDKCISNSVNSALWSRLKAFLSCLPFKLRTCFATFRLMQCLSLWQAQDFFSILKDRIGKAVSAFYFYVPVEGVLCFTDIYILFRGHVMGHQRQVCPAVDWDGEIGTVYKPIGIEGFHNFPYIGKPCG